MSTVCILFYVLSWIISNAQEPLIWPLPMEYSVSDKPTIYISNTFKMTSNSHTDIMTQAIQRYTTLTFPHIPEATPPNNNIVSILNINIADPSNTDLQYGMDESYQLQFPNTNNEGILTAKTIWGALRGLETFSQIVIYNFTVNYYESYQVDINDKPRFKWRGMLIDTGRHFESVPTIKAVIDSLVYAKYNTLHWHIIDSPSFPYESKVYQNLWKGAYSLYERYTQMDIKQIIQYAYYRGIRVVPEFDIPGHSHSWCKGYPEICPIASCNDKGNMDSNGVLNPASNTTWNVISGLIAEATSLFFDNYIHLGGDEVKTECWNEDPSIQAWMTQNNFTTFDTEQYFDERAQNITYYDNGKQVINWVEVFNLFNQTLDKKFVNIEVWKAEQTLKNVIEAGFNAILADGEHWYLNNVKILWQTAYLNEPYFNITDKKQQELIIGGEAAVWGENVDGSDIFNTMWPRAAAISERLWSPQNVNDTNKAEPRYAYFRCLLNLRGIGAAPYNNTEARTAPYGPGGCYHQ